MKGRKLLLASLGAALLLGALAGCGAPAQEDSGGRGQGPAH